MLPFLFRMVSLADEYFSTNADVVFDDDEDEDEDDDDVSNGCNKSAKDVAKQFPVFHPFW